MLPSDGPVLSLMHLWPKCSPRRPSREVLSTVAMKKRAANYGSNYLAINFDEVSGGIKEAHFARRILTVPGIDRRDSWRIRIRLSNQIRRLSFAVVDAGRFFSPVIFRGYRRHRC